MMAYEIEVVADDRNVCGEAPIWDHRTQALLWVDNESSLVFQLDPETGKHEIISRDLMVSGITLNRQAGYVFGGSAGLHVWRAPGSQRTIASEYEGEKLVFNDIIADARGQVYGGTMYWGPGGMEKHGRLYLFSPNGSIEVLDEGIEASNGLAFSPDERTLYYVDTTARRIYAYDLSLSGSVSGRRTFVQVSTNEGIPDGLTVDRDGFVWCAHWYGAEIVRYDPEGTVERRVRMPARQVSSVMFGGKDLTDLYVTSAATVWRGPYVPPGFDFDAPDMGGQLFRIRTEFRGRPEHAADFA